MVQGVVIEHGCIVDVNPSTQEVVARVPCNTLEDVTAAVSRAQSAQPAWAAMHLTDRVHLCKQAIKKLGEDEEGLAQLITKEMGKVISEAKEEAACCCDKDAYIDLIADANVDEVVDRVSGTTIIRDPHGVVAVLSPWNFPCDEITLLALPALIAGNTVVLKPSEVVPLVGAKVAAAFQAVLPVGTFELLQGDGAIGAALVNSGVNMIGMTGSCATGKKIMAAAAPSLKRLVLELGGKDPMVVFADADLDQAADDAVTYSLGNCGQVCCAVERIYVEESVAKDFEERVAKRAEEWVAGDGFSETSKIGPMVSSMQKAHVTKQVEEALSDGKARLVCRADGQNGGNFYPATVLGDVQQDASLSRDETFGPVVCLSTFDGKEESAVKLANDSEYGLASYVYTSDLDKAKRVARLIKSGQVGINCYSMMAASPKCPWIGAKGSGFGYHSGVEGWKQFSVPKSLVFPAPPGKTVLLATEKPFTAEAVTDIDNTLKTAGYTLKKLEKYTEEQQLLDAIADVDAVIIRSDIASSKVMDAGKNLKLIVRAGAGYDNIDLPAAAERNVITMNTPGANANAVAELAFGMMIANARNHWDGSSGYELKDKSLAVYGFGAVARNLHRIAKSFGMIFSAYDPYLSREQIEAAGAKYCEKVEQLFDSQFVSLHCPATNETKNSINHALLSKMPKNAVLVNTARPEVVHESDLKKILEERKDFSYVADVPPKNLADLHGLPDGEKRVFVTKKKMGAQTAEANSNAGVQAAQQIVGFFERGEMRGQVKP